ncbi:MAG: DUF3050 domain-containing protein [Bdellovibrionales bacterium]|nr:DUF3050 domain-containing protein [Bdellovibrionales bacterium]
MSQIELLDGELLPLREKLLSHPLYSELRSLQDLRRFMEVHCFAVWDFMSLLKRIQRDLTCLSLPWIPMLDPLLARYINELVLQEESDISPDGDYVSHLQLYAKAMEEVGASFESLGTVLENLASGTSLEEAFRDSLAPVAAEEYSRHTFSLAADGGLHEVVAAFAYAREDLIPEMFQTLFEQTEEIDASIFRYYLERHCGGVSEDDPDLLSPALQLLEIVCGENDKLWNEAKLAATSALQQRIQLWDAILTLIVSARNCEEPALLAETFEQELSQRGFSRVH